MSRPTRRDGPPSPSSGEAIEKETSHHSVATTDAIGLLAGCRSCIALGVVRRRLRDCRAPLSPHIAPVCHACHATRACTTWFANCGGASAATISMYIPRYWSSNVGGAFSPATGNAVALGEHEPRGWRIYGTLRLVLHGILGFCHPHPDIFPSALLMPPPLDLYESLVVRNDRGCRVPRDNKSHARCEDEDGHEHQRHHNLRICRYVIPIEICETIHVSQPSGHNIGMESCPVTRGSNPYYPCDLNLGPDRNDASRPGHGKPNASGRKISLKLPSSASTSRNTAAAFLHAVLQGTLDYL